MSRSTIAGDQIPARLYKYQPFTTQSIANLKCRQVWFARPASFNDPLDCGLGFRVDEPSQDDLRVCLEGYERDSGASRQESIAGGLADAEGEPTEEFKRQVVANMRTPLEDRAHAHRHESGVTCFSEEADNLLLWAHYGAGHRGFCLEFDTTTGLFEKVHKVRYSDNWPAVSVTDTWAENTDPSFWARGLLTKATCWEYEKEWRVLHMKPDHPYTYDWQALKGVYFGTMMDDVHKEILWMILRDSGTRFFNVRHRPKSFTLEAAPIEFTAFDFDAAAVEPEG